MRIVFLLILSCWSIHLSAQDADIIVNYEKEDVSLEEIFNDLEDQYGVRFSYATSTWKDTYMNANFQEKPLEDVLDYLLSGQELEYKILSNNILVRKSDEYEEENDEDYKSSIHIKGKVTKASGDKGALDYATISIKNSPIGTFTDPSGAFDLEIPSKYFDEHIVVSYVGFESREYKLSELKDAYLLASLSDEEFAFEEVNIVNRRKPLQIGGINNATVLNNIQISNGTSGVMGNDINRTIQMLPGISAHDDDSADIKIRGSNSDETLMILDGMPIYNTSHYFGIFSGVNTAYIDSVNIFKNTYPLQYGGKTGGLVELFSDRKQPIKISGELNIDLLTASTKFSAPLSSNSSIEIAGRTSIKNVSNEQFNTIKSTAQENIQIENFGEKIKNKRNNPKFNFYDINAKYMWRPTSNNQLTLNYYKCKDNLNNNYNHKFRDGTNNELDLNIVENQVWATNASSLQWTQKINPAITWNSTAHFTYYTNKESNEVKVKKKFKQGGPPPMIKNPEGVDLDSKKENELLDFGINSYIHYKKGKHAFKLGVLSGYQNVDYEFSENKNRVFFGRKSIASFGGFGSYNINFKNKFNLDAGLRATYYDNLRATYLSPRILANFKLNDKISLKSSFSIYQQVVRQLYFEYRTVPMELWVVAGQNNIPALTSQNYMIGSTFRFGLFTLDIELFNKQLDGVLEYSVLNPTNPDNNPDSAQEYFQFSGDGLIQGVDFILSSGYKGYDTYLSYTLSKNGERFKAINKNIYYPSENDRRHQFKWVNTFHTGHWNFGLNAIYTSGRRYSDLTNFDNNGNILDSEADNRFKRLPAYFRVDLSSGYTFNIGSRSATIQLSVFNLLNNQNVKYIQSVVTDVQGGQLPLASVFGNESSLLNRTVNLGVKIAF